MITVASYSRFTSLLLGVCLLFSLGGANNGLLNLLNLRGGLVPQAEGPQGQGYYEKFTLDYGTLDKKRIAGAMRGFLSDGALSSLPEFDPFMSWWNSYLETGENEIGAGRLKPFYAVDFGNKEELRKGENPKVIIVQRKLKTDENNVLLPAPLNEVDVEVREIWQPWLRKRCNFAVRYVVPRRTNIINIMKAKGLFFGEVENEEVRSTTGKPKITTWGRMVFKPTLKQRLQGKKTIVVQRKLKLNDRQNAPNKKFKKQI